MRFTRQRRIFAVMIIGMAVLFVGYLTGCPGQEEPEISVFMVETGTVETMPIEEYVAGVVAGEMKEDWPREAYAAQAILARTFTQHFIEQGGSEHGTDISTDHEEAQAFNAEEVTDVIEQAVEDTRGEVMLYNGNYVRGWFHAAAGGRTALAGEGLNFDGEEPPYITSVESPDMGQEVDEDAREWTASFTEDELLATLAEMGADGGIDGIDEIRVAEEGPSGRATMLEFEHPGGTESVHAADFRVALGAERLRSSFYTEPIEREGDEFVFSGKGFGHGVGMSQWGAFVMARRGRSPEDIILHYFDNIDIEKKW